MVHYCKSTDYKLNYLFEEVALNMSEEVPDYMKHSGVVSGWGLLYIFLATVSAYSIASSGTNCYTAMYFLSFDLVDMYAATSLMK